MKKDKCNRNLIITSCIASSACFLIGLMKLIQYLLDFSIQGNTLLLCPMSGISITVFYILLFRDEISMGKSGKKSFILGFIPVLITLIFNVSVYLFLKAKI